MNKQERLHVLGNIMGLSAISFLLILAFLDQLFFHDLPCPLCLLQRISFVAIGLCFLMNLRIGFRPAHYGLMLLAALLGLAIATRQIYIHLSPNDPGYGMQFWGLHLYVWSAIGFITIMSLIGIALIFDRGFKNPIKIQNKWLSALICLFLFLILANGISTFIECGPHVCPDNPIFYYF